MKKAILVFLPTLLLFSVIAAHPATAPSQAEDTVIGVQVSPSTILLDWKAKAADLRVTVHAEVRYRFFDEMETIKVWLEGIPADYIYSDARGDLVAKFDYAVLKLHFGDDFESGEATLAFEATDEDGNEYNGTDVVRVVNR